MPVLAATSPADCFDAAFQACKIALEHMTPVVLLTDAYIANGSGAFKLPVMEQLDAINPPYVPEELKGKWTPYMRAENGTRYWAVPGREGFTPMAIIRLWLLTNSKPSWMFWQKAVSLWTT